MRPKDTQTALYFFSQMSQQIAISLLRQGSTGNEILNILDALVSRIEQENINDCAEYFASLHTPTLEEVQF